VDEDVRRDEAALGVIPADQRLEADELLRLRIDQRLEDQVELLGGDRAPQIGLEADAVLLLGLQLGGEVASAAAAGVLRLVEREVGLEDQVVDGSRSKRRSGSRSGRSGKAP
jgi:hypothetical protein